MRQRASFLSLSFQKKRNKFTPRKTHKFYKQIALSYLNVTVHRSLQSSLFVPLTFHDAGVSTVDVGVLVFVVSNEWSWSLHRIVGGELTEEEKRSCAQKGGRRGEEWAKRDWRTKLEQS